MYWSAKKIPVCAAASLVAANLAKLAFSIAIASARSQFAAALIVFTAITGAG